MKQIEWFWNLLHYNLYRLDIKASRIFNYLNPIYWINKIPKIRKHYLKHGIDDMNEFMQETFENSKNGSSTIVAGGAMGVLIIFIEVSILNITSGILKYPLYDKEWTISIEIIALIILILPAMLLNNFLLFRKDKYLVYFREFAQLPKGKANYYGWLTFISIIAIITFFISSFFAL